jgi:hypothetical protein
MILYFELAMKIFTHFPISDEMVTSNGVASVASSTQSRESRPLNPANRLSHTNLLRKSPSDDSLR